MTDNTEPQKALQFAGLARRVMKKQAALSLRVAAVFIVAILGLPLFNYLQPKTAAVQVFGFTLSWLFLGICFFPITWILSAYFVGESDTIEAEAGQFRVVDGDANAAGVERPVLTVTDAEGK